MQTSFFQSLRLTLLSLLLLSGVYTTIVWAMAQCAPGRGLCRQITVHQHRMFTAIGQSFTSDRYFQSRPSANDYNPSLSGGSNKGPSDPEYLRTLAIRIDSFRVHNPQIPVKLIPSELLTASGSGLDPHISLRAALVQVPRIASVRKISPKRLQHLIHRYYHAPMGGFAGPGYVTLLELNVALDKLSQSYI